MAHIMNDNSDPNPFPLLGTVYGKGSGGSYVKQLSIDAANINVIASQIGTRSSTASVWGCPNLMHKLRMQCNGNSRTTQTADSKNLSSCGHELSSTQNRNLEQGCSVAASQVGSTPLNTGEPRKEKDENLPRFPAGGAGHDKKSIACKNDDYDDDDQIVFGSSDDDDLLDYNSDLVTSETSNQRCKRRNWFESFFDDLNKLNIEELNSTARKWHCPACKGGPGAIDWYRGLEPLMHHAVTRKTRRVKLHRVFAEFLNEETRKRGMSVAPVGVAFGRWQGLNERVKDYEIIWPPMIVIMNTRHEQKENGKWIGMGNQELLDHFKPYAALKARHSYGPQGHRGMSMLIFDDSTAGYLEAARLHKHFKEQGRDREAWKSNRFPFCSGGKRQLYGYMASKEDLEFFNQHSQGRSKLKFEMRSYQEMVEKKIGQINENNQQLEKCKDKMAKEQKHLQILAESVIWLSEELRKTTEKNRSMRQQNRFLLEENKEEMNSQEQFFMDQIKLFHQALDAKQGKFEKLQQANQEKVGQPNANLSAIKETHKTENIVCNVSLGDKEMEMEREKLIKSHEDKKAVLIKRCCEELLNLEKEFENELTQLMRKYKNNSDHPEANNS
ncbi:protein SUPPRESSOR OF GENE SILENCING 3 [Ricinus communis]|uniref:protein SUPPRESSOR OF GENE SILENCING 3 n=1 Tax=Ricinus communis TaxID=3988 RepID=UPI00201AC364|nr:protein SUPPRESSOR OF GENE SILENCING 3 [Ricinus communis]XP_048232098.1 protein SUPPRESSOR OF GENE SILENCING 3 [Ricinus communis]